MIPHIRTILQALQSPNLTQELKLSTIIYLKNLMRSRIENKIFSKDESHAILQTFVELILTGSLNDQLLQNLNLGLTSLLNSSYITEDSEITINICSFLVTQINSLAGIKDLLPTRFKPIILLLQTIVSSSCTNETNGIQVKRLGRSV